MKAKFLRRGRDPKRENRENWHFKIVKLKFSQNFWGKYPRIRILKWNYPRIRIRVMVTTRIRSADPGTRTALFCSECNSFGNALGDFLQCEPVQLFSRTFNFNLTNKGGCQKELELNSIANHVRMTEVPMQFWHTLLFPCLCACENLKAPGVWCRVQS